MNRDGKGGRCTITAGLAILVDKKTNGLKSLDKS